MISLAVAPKANATGFGLCEEDQVATGTLLARPAPARPGVPVTPVPLLPAGYCGRLPSVRRLEIQER